MQIVRVGTNSAIDALTQMLPNRYMNLPNRHRSHKYTARRSQCFTDVDSGLRIYLAVWR